MAKAVFTAGAHFDPRLLAELASLRARVAQLEAEVSALRIEQASFDDEVMSLSEPAVLA
ncbi:MAG: hypothetical protein MUE31_04550 [Candidatus Nanopelagicales bacterium]|jgi:S-adenosylmethionine:tRNA-ribosyltransferase-isomerase (queuine synthetase)|nr:hypothetical protein [Candidatus Nanopelagicales bacterium]